MSENATFTTTGGIAEGQNNAFSHSMTAQCDPICIWALWTDVATWPAWDTELQAATIVGAFKKGAKGTLIPKSGAKSKFVVTELVEGQHYTFVTFLPLARLEITRQLSTKSGATTFIHRVRFVGPLGKLFAWIFGAHFRKALPVVMQQLAQQAEAIHKGRPT